MKDVFFGSSLPANLVSQAQALQRLAAAKRSAAGKLFMKFDKAGNWVYGLEEEDATVEQWALNPASFNYGMIGWDNGAVAGEFVVPIGAPPSWTDTDLRPIKSTKQGDGWKDQLGVELRGMTSEIEVVFKTTSFGGKALIAELAGKVGAQLDIDPLHPVAVVRLYRDFYTHKSYGRIYTPQAEVMGWADTNGVIGDAVPRIAKRKLI